MRILLASPLALGLALAGCQAPTATYQPRLYDTAPVAVIDAAPTAPLFGEVVLDGSGSYDPDGDDIVFGWRVHAAPPDSELPANPFDRNGDRNASTTAFAPDVLGRYTIGLQVDDGQIVSESAYAVVDVVPDGTDPVADAGLDTAGLEGAAVCLDGAGSFDPLGVELTFSWLLATRPGQSTLSTSDLSGADTSEACFVPDAAGLYTVGLVVDAGGRTSAPDFIDVTVGSTNQPPLALPEALNETSCSYVTVNGSASSDPDGDVLGYRWHMLLRPYGSSTPLGMDAFDDANDAAPSFYADLEGEYLVQLAVFDGESWSDPALLTIDATEKLENTPPVVGHQGDIYFGEAPSPCASACTPKQVVLDATSTLDPDGDPLTVSWQVVSGNGQLESTEGLTAEIQLPGPAGSCAWGSSNESMTIVRVTATDCSGDVDESEIILLYECSLGL